MEDYLAEKLSIYKADFDKYTIKEIHELIEAEIITNQDVIDFYNNEWWDDNQEE